MNPPTIDDVLERFHPAVAGWFREQFEQPTEVQLRGWDAISRGGHVLLGAPTGSGKTLAAFLWGLSMLAEQGVPQPEEGGADAPPRLRVVYISPLRALNYDIERNLRAPLAGIARHAARNDEPVPDIRVGVRTGDTPQAERQRQRRNPPDILITTPESLYVMLTSGARELFTGVQQVIIDEIHALAGSKRGTHLALTLERLVEQAGGADVQRIGLSATQKPMSRVAAFLGGAGRDVTCIDTRPRKEYDVQVRVPVDDMTAIGMPISSDLGELDVPQSNADSYSIWGALHEELLDEVEAHRSTIIFVNSRRLAERVAGALNDLAARRAALRAQAAEEAAAPDRGDAEDEHDGGEQRADAVDAGADAVAGADGSIVARAHHGSVSREARRDMEDLLKAGQLPAIVATSSLELGIDMGAVDLVLHVESPRSVASGIQRIGRAGHNVGDVSVARIYPKHRRDLLECAAVTRAVVAGDIEPVKIPERCLDVLAQQLVAIGVDRDVDVAEALELVTRADPYRDLTREQLDNVLSLLAGYFPTDDMADLKARVVWNREAGTYRSRSDAARVAISNAGTIPDRGLYGVFVAGGGSGRRVGELDEEMVHETRLGDVIVLGATSWRVEEITRDRVLVTPVPGAIGKMPFWHGEGAGRTVQLGRQVGELARTIAPAAAADAADEAPTEVDPQVDGPLLARLQHEWRLDPRAATNLVRYIREQAAATGEVPSDRTVVVERFRDELGDWRICILTPWGKSVHAPWAMAIEARLAALHGLETQALWSDDGIALRLPDTDLDVPLGDLLPDPEEVEELVIGELADSALFASRFREVATRSLLLPLGGGGARRRAPLWLQRLRAHDVLKTAQQHGSFPMVLETYRECLRDVFDMPALRELLGQVRDRTVRVVEARTRTASPFAAALLFDYTAALMYDNDRPAAERRAQALALDQALLRELLGSDDVRELLEQSAIDEVGDELQRRAEQRRARSADQLHDMLRELGDLSREELRERVREGEPLDEWVAQLERERRITCVRLAGDQRFVAVEDVGTYVAALGVQPPAGVPHAFLAEPEQALARILARRARTLTPFTTRQLGDRWGLADATVEGELAAMKERGELLRGGFLPAGSEPEWCEPDVLRRLRRRTLALLRRQVEPVDAEAYSRLLLGWHGINDPVPGSVGAVREVVLQLEGVEDSPAAWERDLVAPRLASWRRAWLEELVQTGQLVWLGRGMRHGAPVVALYLREHLTLMAPPAGNLPEGEDVALVAELLERRGASFLREVVAETGITHSRALEALWQLAAAGWCSNDSWATVRSGPPRAQARGAAGRRSAAGSANGIASAGPPTMASRRVANRMARRSLRSATMRGGTGAGGADGDGSQIDVRFQGRWALLPREREPEHVRVAAMCEALLDCYGVVTRGVVAARDVPGGFSAVYRELARHEELGGVRRGYFIEGLGGAQFALPEAVDRLRALREAPPPANARVIALRANDPVQPYGTVLPWPQREDGVPAPTRSATAYVMLRGGELVAHMAPAGKKLTLYAGDALPQVARALAGLIAARRIDRLAIEQVDGGEVTAEHAAAFAGTGFVRTPRGVRATASTLPDPREAAGPPPSRRAIEQRGPGGLPPQRDGAPPMRAHDDAAWPTHGRNPRQFGR